MVVRLVCPRVTSISGNGLQRSRLQENYSHHPLYERGYSNEVWRQVTDPVAERQPRREPAARAAESAVSPPTYRIVAEPNRPGENYGPLALDFESPRTPQPGEKGEGWESFVEANERPENVKPECDREQEKNVDPPGL